MFNLFLPALPVVAFMLCAILLLLLIWRAVDFRHGVNRRAWRFAAFAGGLVVVTFATLFGVDRAFAQSATDLANAVCSPTGQRWMIAFFGLIGVSTLVDGAKNKIAKGPAWLQVLAHLAAANLPQVVRVLRGTAAVVLVAVFVTGCAFTGNPSVDLASFGKQVSAFNSDFATKAKAFNAQVAATVVPAGKAACGFASEADGFFKSALGQVAVEAGNSAAGGTAADIAAIDASEAATFAKVQEGCKVVDAMDPANPTQDEIATVAALVQDVPHIQADIAKLSPTAAALIKPAS